MSPGPTGVASWRRTPNHVRKGDIRFQTEGGSGKGLTEAKGTAQRRAVRVTRRPEGANGLMRGIGMCVGPRSALWGARPHPADLGQGTLPLWTSISSRAARG